MADAKEIAEHNMLVDLGRNDVGRVSEFGTVKVLDYLEIKKFSHVMHITSRVTGRLRADKDCLDALQSVFPAGTLSGARRSGPARLLMSWNLSVEGFTAVVWAI